MAIQPIKTTPLSLKDIQDHELQMRLVALQQKDYVVLDESFFDDMLERFCKTFLRDNNVSC